jgi:hypothetical protein
MWAYTVSVLEAMDFDPMEYTESRISRLEQEVAALKTTAYFAQTAKEASLECVVNMSQKSACEDAPSHAAQDHWLSEQDSAGLVEKIGGPPPMTLEEFINKHRAAFTA